MTSQCDELITLYASEYMEQVFYFCLKRTGDPSEAEELASDITESVLVQLRRGNIPERFSAWVWRIARNRYSAWADGKRHRAASAIGQPLHELEVAGGADIEAEHLHDESLALLRRELAFISSDYRQLVAAYYLEGRSVGDIASRLRMPEGTVMSRLHRIRKKLKEGIDMAREFGKMSYSPENIDFIMNGRTGRMGEPHSYINRMLCKNILLAAYKTPSTAEALAIELGIALPYMEDELKGLVQSTLMREENGKYETRFYIASADAQRRAYDDLKARAPELCAKIIELVEYETRCHEENGTKWHGGWQPYEDMKWALLMRETDTLHLMSLDDYPAGADSSLIGPWGHRIRPNGGEWGLFGMEDTDTGRPALIGLHGSSVDMPESARPVEFAQYKFAYMGIENKTPAHLTYEQATALLQVATGTAYAAPQKALDKLTEYGYLELRDGECRPTFMVLYRNDETALQGRQREEYDRLFAQARTISRGHFEACRDIVRNEFPEFLRDDLHELAHACGNLFSIREAVLSEALRTGYITYEENDTRTMLGAYLIVD